MLYLPWIIVVFPSVAGIIVGIAFIALVLIVFVGPMGKCFSDNLLIQIDRYNRSSAFQWDSFTVFGVCSLHLMVSEETKRTKRITMNTFLLFEDESVKMLPYICEIKIHFHITVSVIC